MAKSFMTNPAESGFGAVIHIGGDTEITQNRQALRGDENVAGLDVVMDDIAAMRGEQRA